MKTIWKYELNEHGVKVIKMPLGAEILTIQSQHDKPVLWALVDPEEYHTERVFEIAGTGHPLYKPEMIRKYIGTYQSFNGDFIGHVFEIIEQ